MSDIAINPVTRRVQFTGNTGTGPYAFNFNVLQSSDIVVYKNNVLLTETTDYTVSIAANGTGNITMVVALVLTDILTIIGGRELSRTTDFVTAGDLLASSLNEQLDSNVIMSQQLDERFGRTIKAQPGDEDATLDLPLVDDRKSKLLSFDANGNATASTATDFFVGGNFTNNTYTGDGSTTSFVLTVDPGTKNNVQVYIDGVYQNKATFSITASSLTFTEAPPLNSAIEFLIGSAVDSVGADANRVNYNQGGTGAVNTNVAAKLQETVSVKDFGAVGDGVTDDTAAIQACIDAVEASTYGGVVFFPAGIYKITSAITVSDKKVSIKGEGAEASVISALSCNGINFNSGSYDRGTSFVEDIGLEGRTGSTANFAGIESILPPGGVSGTDSRDGLHFHRVKLFNFNQGFIISDTWEWSIKGCKFQKVTNPISLGNYSMVGRIVDNYMVYENGDDFSGTANPYGIDFSGTIHEGIVIRGNQMNKFERCITIPQATSVSITENDFDGTSYGIHISAAEGGCNIENNYFAITTASAKGIFGAAQATTIRALVNIRGNHFEATAPATSSVGIEINTVGATNQWNWRIKDNNFRGLASFDILSYNSGDLLVEGNRCQSTGTTHSISINDVSSSAPCYIRNNICENTINVTASDVANGDVILTDNYANGAKDYGNAFKDQIALVDGITAPSTLAGYAQLYVDTADGDLKIRFGDGTVKTIVVDT